MKKLFIFSLNLALVLAVIFSLPASAQAPLPPTGQPTIPSRPPQKPSVPDDLLKTPGAGFSSLPSDGFQTESIQMGAPGTSYRFLKSFGVVTQPYPVDGYHLNGPNGSFIKGTDLYVVEEQGARLLKFDLTSTAEPPTATLTIGHAGIRWSQDDYFSWPRDVTVDSSNNIWVAQNSAVKKFDPAGQLLLSIPANEPWQMGNDNTHFNEIQGLAFAPNGFLFVSDVNNQRIQVYDVSGPDPAYVNTIGENGVVHTDDNGFNNPWRLAFDSVGRLYVMDFLNFRVQRCQTADDWANYSCETAFGETGVRGTDPNDLIRLSWAAGITVHNNGVSDELYLGDGGNGRVLKCAVTTPVPFTCQKYVDGSISPDADFNWTADVSVSSDGKVYVSDYGNHRIQVFEDTGSGAVYQDTIGFKSVPYVVNPSYFNNPWGIAVAKDNSIYVVETSGNRLRKLDAAGTQLWAVGDAGIGGSDTTHFNGPEGNPAIDASGRVYVTDTWNHRVQIYTSAGVFVDTLGSQGSGPGQFQCPSGVAIHPVSGDIYVSETCNQRVQVFSSARVYKATLGLTGSTGRDNWRFNNPRGVAVDKNGNIFVADSDNQRIQKCVLNSGGYSCSTFVGTEDIVNPGFSTLHPMAVAVDTSGRVFAADEWNNRVQVFDASGAYLTTIGGNWGMLDGDMINPKSLALDTAGNVYITESDNQRIQKYALGTPGWKQVNINGFGMQDNGVIRTMAAFGTNLYAGTDSGQLWRSSNGTAWQPVIGNGFNNSGNSFDHLFVYGNKLYAGTVNEFNGSQLWRSADGVNWEWTTPDGFDGRANPEIIRMASYGGRLYFGTWVWDKSHGADMWRSPSGNNNDWTQIEWNGFGDVNNEAFLDFRTFGTNLYVSTFNGDTGTEIWRSPNGAAGTWTQVNADGFGDGANYGATMSIFGGYLYAATGHGYDGLSPAQIWRCQLCDGTDWYHIPDPFGDPKVMQMPGLIVANGAMYLTVGVKDVNNTYGMNVYRSTNGTTWTAVATAGFGNKNNRWSYYGNALEVFNQQLYVGTGNFTNGAQIWRAAADVTGNFYSSAAQDGWILESTETSNTGGSMNATLTTFQLGDDAAKKQYRAVLSFDTASIPDSAVIKSVTLRIKQSGLPTGTNPFNVLGSLLVDTRKPFFGTSAALELADFNFAPSSAKVGTIGKLPVAGWYSAALNAAGKTNLNKTGLTQFRLYFSLDDNNNAIADTMKFFSGNSATGKPELIVNYTLAP